jgi:kinesin family protein C2/C3
MQGYGENYGISPRAINELFAQVSKMTTWNYSLTLSMLEIYNETIRDLLDSSNPKDREKKQLEIRQTPEGNIVPGLTEVLVSPSVCLSVFVCLPH